jgi:hypothetical protein
MKLSTVTQVAPLLEQLRARRAELDVRGRQMDIAIQVLTRELGPQDNGNEPSGAIVLMAPGTIADAIRATVKRARAPLQTAHLYDLLREAGAPIPPAQYPKRYIGMRAAGLARRGILKKGPQGWIAGPKI